MISQPIPAYAPSNDGFASINLRTDPAQGAGLLRETVLRVLLAALLLILLPDIARAAERGTAPRVPAADAGVPTYSIDAICRDAASVAHLLETTAPDNAQNCIEDERRARKQLVTEWLQFDVADRVMCHGAARSGSVEPAYTELMTCLEITRDNHAREASAHVARQPDQPRPIRNAVAAR